VVVHHIEDTEQILPGSGLPAGTPANLLIVRVRLDRGERPAEPQPRRLRPTGILPRKEEAALPLLPKGTSPRAAISMGIGVGASEAAASVSWRKVVRMAIWTLVLAVSSLFFLFFAPQILTYSKVGSDFSGLYAAAHALRLWPTANIYDQHVLASAFGPDLYRCVYIANVYHGMPYPYPFAFPPLLAVLMEPLTSLPCETALQLWTAGSIVLWLVAAGFAAALLYRSWASRETRAYAIPLALGTVLISPMMIDAISFGQIFTLVLALLLAAFWFLPHRPRVAGALLALAALLQVFPGLYLVYSLLTRQWQVLWGAIITSAISLAIMIWFAPISLLQAPLGILHNGSMAVAFPWNQALARLSVVGPLLAALVLVVWAMTAYLRRAATPYGYGWTSITALLISPLLQTAFLIWLLPALAVIAAPYGSRLRAPIALMGYLAITIFARTIIVSHFAVWVPLVVLTIWIVVGLDYDRVQKAWPSNTHPSSTMPASSSSQ
jgi:hypothetical protein